MTAHAAASSMQALVVTWTRRESVSDEQLEELGPIDHMVLEWQGELPATGEVQRLLLELVDRGIIRILDIAFVTKGPDGAPGPGAPVRAAVPPQQDMVQQLKDLAELKDQGILTEEESAVVPPRRPGRSPGPRSCWTPARSTNRSSTD
jgi:hypothetical protein